MTDRAESYAHGFSDGTRYAEHDARERPAAVHNEIIEITEEIAGARRGETPSGRAYVLGMARGYRSAVRTLRGGRWGT